MIKDRNNRNLILYYFFPGLCLGFYATYVYKLVELSLPQKDQEDDD